MATTKFVHPGILINKTDLELIKAKVAAKQEPWTAALAKMQTSGMSSVLIVGLPALPCTAGSLLGGNRPSVCSG